MRYACLVLAALVSTVGCSGSDPRSNSQGPGQLLEGDPGSGSFGDAGSGAAGDRPASGDGAAAGDTVVVGDSEFESCSVAESCTQSGFYCQFVVGSCGLGGVSGFCRLMPNSCIEVYDPVCGCDGNTYSNSCFAEAAGVSVSYMEECETSPITD